MKVTTLGIDLAKSIFQRESRQRLKSMEATRYEESCENNSDRGGFHAHAREDKRF